MEKDKSGNLLFRQDVLGDTQRVQLVRMAIDRYSDSSKAGKNQAITNKRAKGMIDAGIIPDDEDLLALEAMPLTERIGRFLRGAHRIPLVAIREDELNIVCEQLRTEPLDHELHAFDLHHGENSKKATKLADEIQNLQPGEFATPQNI